MGTDQKWIIVRIDGKIAAVSTDYRLLASISSSLAEQGTSRNRKGRHGKSGKSRTANAEIYNKITAEAIGFDELWDLRQNTKWEDLMLFGTDFQKKVWQRLWILTHPESETRTEGIELSRAEDDKAKSNNFMIHENSSLVSYSDFAELCQNRSGVRAVAHAIGLNPVAVIIPCHLVVPKESIDKMREINKKAEATIFKGDDLCISSILSDSSIDFGEYSHGREMKRKLIIRELSDNR